MINVYVGWDSREVDAYDVCCSSLMRNTSTDYKIQIIPLKTQELYKRGLYNRVNDPLASTEFTYTRFLVPVLQQYTGIAVFCDCDFLWQNGIDELMKSVEFDDEKAVYVCQHDYIPQQAVKMDNKIQSSYPRKNWSSLIIWNCSHKKNRELTCEKISSETGAYLHRFSWLNDNEIGEINIQWNWLVGEYNAEQHGTPRALHYTNGGPWFENYTECPYASQWYKEFYLRQRRIRAKT